MKEKLFFFGFLLLCFLGNVRGAGLQEAPPFATHGIFIFLDDTERDFGTVTTSFFLAMEQHAGPILFSGSLMQNLLQQPSLENLIQQSESQEEKRLLKKLLEHIDHIVQQFRLIIKEQPTTIDEKKSLVDAINTVIQPDENLKQFIHDNSVKIEAALLKEISLLNPDDWVLNKVNEYLFMLIPKEYSALMEKKFSEHKHTASKKFTPRELALGLKVDHLPVITNSWIDYFSSYKRASANKPSSYFISALPTIFISRAEYLQQLKDAENGTQGTAESFRLYSTEIMPKWTVYLKGHGKLADIISWLSLAAFTEFLNFLANNIITRLFVYESCYAAGINLALIYRDLETNAVQSYPFAIALAGLTDAPIFIYQLELPLYDFKVEDINFKNKRPIIRPRISYAEFLHYVTSQDPISYAQALGYIFPTPKKASEIQNQPQLKLPGTPWFNIVDSDQLLVNIGSTLARTRGKNKPLNIFNFFQKTNILGVLLEARVIPFELIVTTNKILPHFISMIPGTALHLMKKISSTTHSSSDIFKSFTQGISFLLPRKTFIIEEIESSDHQGENSLHSVVIDMNKDVVSIFYMRDGMPYRLNAKFEEEKTASNYMDSYRKLIAEDPFLQEEKEAFKGISDISKAVGKKAQELKTSYKKLHPKKKKLTI